jgi:hypothetical protein
MYTVRRLREARAVSAEDARVPAANHRDAAARSLLAEPGAELIVSDGHTTIRYHVDQIGRIVEQSRYTA